MPSPACEISLVPNRRRKPVSASTARRSVTNDEATDAAYGVHQPPTMPVTSWKRMKGVPASAVDFAADELLHQVPAHVVAVLLRRRLHEVRGRREHRPADAAVLGDLG